MFKFVPGAVRHAWWPVKWQAAAEDGTVVNNQITMRFVLHDDVDYQTLTTDTAASFDAKWQDLTGDAREQAQRGARAEYVQLFATGWRDIADAHDAPLPWEPAILAPFLQLPGVMTAVLEAHAAARRGARPNG
jgi:hypothetical protein